MGIIYSILGVLHFTNTQFYRPLMPKFLPAHDFLIYLSGIAEIVLGKCKIAGLNYILSNKKYISLSK